MFLHKYFDTSSCWLYDFCEHACIIGVSVACVVCRERQNQAKINRKMDKRVKELMLQVEDERRLADQFKDQVNFTHFYFYFQFYHYIFTPTLACVCPPLTTPVECWSPLQHLTYLQDNKISIKRFQPTLAAYTLPYSLSQLQERHFPNRKFLPLPRQYIFNVFTYYTECRELSFGQPLYHILHTATCH